MRETPQIMFTRLNSSADVLTQVLEAVNLGGALTSRTQFRAPWALHFGSTRRRAGFHVIAKGNCWATADGSGEQAALSEGDVLVFPHGAGHTLGDDPRRPAIEVSNMPVDDLPLPHADGEPTTVLCGAYSFSADGSNPLLRGLPDMLHIPAHHMGDGPLRSAVRLLVNEVEAAGSGATLVLDRLVDLLFVYALRTWLERREGEGIESWFGALHDPVVGPAVRALHDEPAHAWTVAALAKRSGMSRAAFARRFSRAVGEAPLNYLTRWRMTLASDLLAKGERIARVAHQVGYENEFAFAKAFKRVRGVAPGQLRRRERP